MALTSSGLIFLALSALSNLAILRALWWRNSMITPTFYVLKWGWGSHCEDEMSFRPGSILHRAFPTPRLQWGGKVARQRQEEMEFSNSNFQPIAQSVAHGSLLFFTIKFKFPALLFFSQGGKEFSWGRNVDFNISFAICPEPRRLSFPIF